MPCCPRPTGISSPRRQPLGFGVRASTTDEDARAQAVRWPAGSQRCRGSERRSGTWLSTFREVLCLQRIAQAESPLSSCCGPNMLRGRRGRNRREPEPRRRYSGHSLARCRTPDPTRRLPRLRSTGTRRIDTVPRWRRAFLRAISLLRDGPGAASGCHQLSLMHALAPAYAESCP